MLIKNLRQSLVQLAEVIPTSSGRSSYPPSALTRGRLAHFSEIGIYAGNSVNRTDPDWNKVEHRDRSAKSLSHFHAPTLYYAISQPSWLHFVFPTLAQGCFSFFSLWVFDWRFWAEQHFFSSCEKWLPTGAVNTFPIFLKRSCITSIQQSSNPFFPQCPKRSFIVMHVISILKCFPCLMAPIAKPCFSIFGSGAFVSIGSVSVGSFPPFFSINTCLLYTSPSPRD